MERKSVNAVLVNEFEDFLKEKNLYQKYVDKELLCSKCNQVITSDNIALIYFAGEYKFCCNKKECMDL